MSEVTNAELATLVTELSARLEAAEAEIAELRRRSDASIPEDVIIAISAAVSAFLGNKGRVKAVSYSRHRTWAAQGRQTVQQRKLSR
ncbi:hypothetical protein P4N68_08430 [Corynebacterium felinum]|uniref:Methylmalonyl-CoA carboxyltransferase large subunit n=1 Tax=Corynebacterium felinum TaxID=131318 RepID=A0ABU2B9M3_9CORY|nr:MULTISPECIES: hypothetical protein [Corynebacterium]MDF5821103.1 hypothetical protein [Corynebacterium felinum]MDO4761206.1 hypothetical protein [Corynebacterium sp.]MDR7354971.1 methylmalonyl-CoA carboxyltransferase large subunit [Corynebacterium felinum]WJY94327.1 Methylmalonyl-CoA carboxyltransferase 12S subunit [Corynebacterium felinum]